MGRLRGAVAGLSFWAVAALSVAGCGGPPAPQGGPVDGIAAGAPPITSPTGGVNELRHIPGEYLVLVSFDGFRADYFELYDTPTFDRVIDRGAWAEGLIPSYPSLTFPSHYTIATGLWPENHGLVGNAIHDPVQDRDFYFRNSEDVSDGTWYGGEPIWATAENQGMVSASYFWVGAEAEIAGARPTFWYPYDGSVTGEQKVDRVLEWLALPEENRPHVITLYFPDVDGAGHGNGPLSSEVEAAVRRVDGYLDRLIRGISTLRHGDRVNLVLVSDHGMAEAPPAETAYIDLSSFPAARFVGGGASAAIHVDGGPAEIRRVADAVRDQVPADIDVHLRDEAPRELHIAGTARAGDILVVPPIGVTVAEFRPGAGPGGGPRWTHGWVPDDPIMHGIFVAAGPRIREGARLRPVRAVDVYPFLTALVGLEAPDVDGDPSVLGSLISN
jgi:predicted AlkP superfamily pyrophosphatase or phosphodiesterase